MKTVTFAILLLLNYANTARVTKRGLYPDGPFYGSHQIFYNEHPVHTQYQPKPKIITPTYNYHYENPLSYGLNNFGSFLPSFHESIYHYHMPTFDSGYNYEVPTGPKFEEEPMMDSFNLLIQPALTPMAIANAKLGPGLRAPMRRILTSVNQNLFYQYPGVIPEPGLSIRVPIEMARPTRVVVPHHGRVAIGSGGLGYRTLPGGRIALGSGSVGVTNLAVARAALINPKAQVQQPTQNFQQVVPRNFLPASSNSLTVFPLTDDQKNNIFG